MRIIPTLLLAWTLGLPAMAQPAVDLSALDRDMAGPRTQVLVLGTYHLAEYADALEVESLEPLLQRLEGFAPDMITIEQVPGIQCDMVARYPGVFHPESWAPYCFDTAPAREATGLDVPQATARMQEMLRGWPEAPAPAQRRELASVFLAAGEPDSALVQWLRLEEAERRAGDGLDQGLVELLRERAGRVSETRLIAVPLAVGLGLERLHHVDDHTGDDGHIDDVQAYGEAIQDAWDRQAERMAAALEPDVAAVRSGDMLAAYRLANSPEELQVKVEADFGAALADQSPEGYGRFYVAGWETRNLRMVANIRHAIRAERSRRVLSIVGATHKPWFDSLLGQMQGVDIVDAQQVLR